VTRWAERVLALAACLGCSCGDPSTAALPVDLDHLGPAVPEPSARAVVALRLASASPVEECGLDVEVFLPTSEATETLISGVGKRLVDGADASVACRVEPAGVEIDAFDIDLRVQQGASLRLQWSGTVRSSTSGSVAIDIALPDASWSAMCTAQVDEVRAGAVWMGSLTCPEPHRGSALLTSCVLTGGVIFENCTGR